MHSYQECISIQYMFQDILVFPLVFSLSRQNELRDLTSVPEDIVIDDDISSFCDSVYSIREVSAMTEDEDEIFSVGERDLYARPKMVNEHRIDTEVDEMITGISVRDYPT